MARQAGEAEAESPGGAANFDEMEPKAAHWKEGGKGRGSEALTGLFSGEASAHRCLRALLRAMMESPTETWRWLSGWRPIADETCGRMDQRGEYGSSSSSLVEAKTVLLLLLEALDSTPIGHYSPPEGDAMAMDACVAAVRRVRYLSALVVGFVVTATTRAAATANDSTRSTEIEWLPELLSSLDAMLLKVRHQPNGAKSESQFKHPFLPASAAWALFEEERLDGNPESGGWSWGPLRSLVDERRSEWRGAVEGLLEVHARMSEECNASTQKPC